MVPIPRSEECFPLTGLLLSAIVAAVAATAVALSIPSRPYRPGALSWTRRLLFAVLGSIVIGTLGGCAMFVFNGGHPRRAGLAFILLVGACLVWIPATRRWNARAHLCWSTSIYLFGVYLVFMFQWTLRSPVSGAGLVGAFALWGLEVLTALLGVVYLWEMCDAIGSEHWRRRTRVGADNVPDPYHPFVSLHVPAHNEPPEMVIATVRSLLHLDYDRFEIIVIDDNTGDESLWRPVEQWCADHGITFAHLADWPGYKSGALNYALRELTDPRAEVIGVIDADYQIDPRFLARCAPLFAEPRLGFVQSPQDYRDGHVSAFQRRLYHSYQYFFAVSQPSRNERDGAIFAGTMGLIRRQALEGLGGWDEWCITEDAELSLRLLRAGWSGRHVDTSYGYGVMPVTFEAFKGQRFRWCFGGIQILRMHWRSLLPLPRGRDNRLTQSQRWAYLSGAFQWYGDLLAVLFFFFLMAGAVNVALDGGLLFRKLSLFLLAAIPVLVLLGFLRGIAVVRRGTGANWRDAWGALLIWQSTSLVVARASLQGLVARRAEFLRTPKEEEHQRWWRAVTANLPESIFAVVGAAGIVAGLTHANTLGGALTGALLVLPTWAFLSAPLNSLAARRAPVTPGSSTETRELDRAAPRAR
ncbi:MAG: glycosyltransferase [Nocardioides sp.]|nr:glycosyltransferase [Nocardioides sp.]